MTYFSDRACQSHACISRDVAYGSLGQGLPAAKVTVILATSHIPFNRFMLLQHAAHVSETKGLKCQLRTPIEGRFVSSINLGMVLSTFLPSFQSIFSVSFRHFLRRFSDIDFLKCCLAGPLDGPPVRVRTEIERSAHRSGQISIFSE